MIKMKIKLITSFFFLSSYLFGQRNVNMQLVISGSTGTVYLVNPADESVTISSLILSFNLPVGTTIVNPPVLLYGLVSQGGGKYSSASGSSGSLVDFDPGVPIQIASFNFSGPVAGINLSSDYNNDRFYISLGGLDRSGSTSTILPITLQSFTAKKVTESSSLLEWTTASEEDAESIDIERSFDAKTWTKLATQQAVGGLNLSTDYSYLDKDVVLQRSEGATAYYRLYLRDKDGSGKYSDVRSVAFDPITGINFVAYPNPANTNLQLKLQMVSDQPSTQVNILDISGKLVQKANVSTNGITNIDVSNFAKGLYHLQMIHNDQVVVRKVVVN
jgi:hypothetical protein